MRVFLIGLVLALVALIPAIFDAMDRDLPSALALVDIPYTGLGYVKVFFHELGHFFTRWFFGYMAFPSFDFAHGGGVTMHRLDRSYIVLGLVYAGFAYVAWIHWKDAEMRVVAIVGAVALLHIIASLTKWSEIIPVYMGHGGEILVAGFCIVRATLDWPKDAHGYAEKYLNMVFGLFALLQNLIMNVNLMTSAGKREEYAAAKGGNMQMDMDIIADILNSKVQYVAAGSTVFLLLCCVLIAWLALMKPWQEY